MKSGKAILLLLAFSLPSAVFAQKTEPKGALTPTDKQAVEAWTRATSGRPDQKDVVAGDTQFLLSLSDEQRQGAYLFKQHCDACHGPEMSRATSYGPALSKVNVDGKEDNARKQISEGSDRMPAFKYALQPAQINLIIEFLKKVDKQCTNKDCRPGDVRRAN